MNAERVWWRQKFELKFVRQRGSAFESFIQQLFELAFPGDYTQVAPAGALGDRKCDGLLPSQDRLFQIYAPARFDKRDAMRKLTGDFDGAVSHWGNRFSTWTLVHNVRDGLPTYVHDFLHDRTQSELSKHMCEEWGFSKLVSLTMDLSDDDLTHLLGPPLKLEDFLEVEVKDIVPLLREVESVDLSDVREIQPVAENKLERNGLSIALQDGIRYAMRRTDQVQRYFDSQKARPTYRDNLALQFTSKYRRLVEEGYESDAIIDSFVAWILPSTYQTTLHAAAMVVIAFFFEQCDIFENPEETDL
ncbi:ABC-three component system protein [Candidatus Poriferisodalis sp.]|uniref:ABC-three component system protein n=1 Tax=Candidatus Poriferisodalis sp. TaxID=3101277 RepID=UPI003B01EB33